MNWEIIYYNEAVRLWVDNLPVGIRAYYARITEAMCQHGPNLGMPYTRALGEELFEIRARGKEGIARVFYGTVVRGKIIILHGFVKKTDKTPRRELATARRRLKEVQDENA
jgi:phage-related protein